MRPDELALRYVGIRERPGDAQEPFIQFISRLAGGPENEQDAWCGSFAYFIASFNLGLEAPTLPRRARSWLNVGREVGPWASTSPAPLNPGDVVILSRGALPQPGPDVVAAPGHVGFFTGRINGTLETWPNGSPGPGATIELVSGNHTDAVTVAAFPVSRVLGARRLGRHLAQGAR